MAEFNAEDQLLLGTVGWTRDDWAQTYYPDDLPEDWRLSYYANDCNAVLLSHAAWQPDSEIHEALADEVPPALHFFLLDGPAGPDIPASFPPERTALLVERSHSSIDDLTQWVVDGPDRWVHPAGDALVQRWWLDTMDLRALRERAATLDPRTRALLLDGPGADPGRMTELRTLLQLLGRH